MATNGGEHGSVAPSGKRGSILANAVVQFNEQGFHDTRLQDIANTMGVRKTNIAYYFKSKDVLLGEAYRYACDFSEAALAAASVEATGAERAISFVRAHLYAHADHLAGRGPPLALMADLVTLQGPAFEEFHRRYEGHVDAFREFLTVGKQDGTVGVRSVEASTFFAFNTMHWIPRWLADVSEKRRAKSIDAFCALLQRGFAGGPALQAAEPIRRLATDQVANLFDREARNRLKREAFLRTGIRHLNHIGYRNLSLDEIAAELGVTRGAFYYHIEDKQALLAQSFERTCDLFESSFALAGEVSDLTACAELERGLRWLFEGHITELDPLLRPNLLRLLDIAPRAVINARLRRIAASYAEIIARGMVDGSIEPIELDALETIVFGSVFSASRRRFAATRLEKVWQPEDEPLTASAAYFEPLVCGFGAR